MKKNPASSKKQDLLHDLLHELMAVYRYQHRYEEAGACHGRTPIDRVNELGPKYPCTLQTLEDFAILYRQKGRVAEAIKLCTFAFRELKATVGLTELQTLRCGGHLAVVYFNQQSYRRVCSILREVLDLARSPFG